jgi:hypothetical protein
MSNTNTIDYISSTIDSSGSIFYILTFISILTSSTILMFLFSTKQRNQLYIENTYTYKWGIYVWVEQNFFSSSSSSFLSNHYHCLPHFFFLLFCFSILLQLDCIPKTFLYMERQTGNTQGYDLPIDERKTKRWNATRLSPLLSLHHRQTITVIFI